MTDQFCKVTDNTERQVDLSRLTPSQKQRVWSYLKTEKPELAALLKDKKFNQVVAAFGGAVLINFSEIKEPLVGVNKAVKRRD